MLIKCFQIATTIKEDCLFCLFVLKLCQMLNQVFPSSYYYWKIVRLFVLFP